MFLKKREKSPERRSPTLTLSERACACGAGSSAEGDSFPESRRDSRTASRVCESPAGGGLVWFNADSDAAGKGG